MLPFGGDVSCSSFSEQVLPLPDGTNIILLIFYRRCVLDITELSDMCNCSHKPRYAGRPRESSRAWAWTVIADDDALVDVFVLLGGVISVFLSKSATMFNNMVKEES
jgi:hypothetical protein